MEISKMVALYVRVSTLEQANEGYSIEEQEVKLKAYCTAMGYSVYKVYRDPGFSGASLERPGIQSLIDDVLTGVIDTVIVWKLDRLSRSQKDTMILLENIFVKNHTNFVSLSESFDTSTPFGRAIVGILAAFAQLERENIKERTALGRMARVKKGYPHSTRCPLGYKFKTGSNELLVDEFSSIQVKEMFQLIINGESISGISRIMDQKYGSEKFNFFRPTSVRRVLKNPVYYGKVKLGKQLFDGLHEPLISESEFILTQSIIKNRADLIKRDYSYKNGQYSSSGLLTNIIFCGDCGARMYPKKISNKTTKYVCYSVSKASKEMIRSDHCSNRLHPYKAEELERIILNEIEKLSLDKSLFDTMINNFKSRLLDSPVKTHQDRISVIQNERKNLLDLCQTGAISIQDIADRLNSLKKEQEHLENIISSLINKEEPVIDTDFAWNLLESFKNISKTDSKEDIHKIVHNLIDRIVVLNEDITIYWSFC